MSEAAKWLTCEFSTLDETAKKTIRTLQIELEQAEQERDATREQLRLCHLAHAQGEKKRTALLTENRLLLGLAANSLHPQGRDWEVNTPLTAAEVERVKGLEKVAEAAKAYKQRCPDQEHCLGTVCYAYVMCSALAALEEKC